MKVLPKTLQKMPRYFSLPFEQSVMNFWLGCQWKPSSSRSGNLETMNASSLMLSCLEGLKRHFYIILNYIIL